jgi:hypothetical protein
MAWRSFDRSGHLSWFRFVCNIPDICNGCEMCTIFKSAKTASTRLYYNSMQQRMALQGTKGSSGRVPASDRHFFVSTPPHCGWRV